MTLFIVGARCLQHLHYLAGDPLVARLSGLARIPMERTVLNRLKQFTRQALIRLTSELRWEQIERLRLRRLTIDVDRTVIHTDGKVAGAFRGLNPHHRKDPGYHTVLLRLRQTGQTLRLRNRLGNVHNSKGAEAFLPDLRGSSAPALAGASPWSSAPIPPSSNWTPSPPTTPTSSIRH